MANKSPRPSVSNNPKVLLNRAKKALQEAKALETKQLAEGGKYVRGAMRSRVLVKIFK